MKYYLANLGVHIAVNLILTLIVIVSSDRNKRGQTKHALTYFLPFVVSIVTVLYMINFTAPRLLDLTDVTGQNYYSYTGTLEEISSMNNYFIIDGEKYYINPLRDPWSRSDIQDTASMLSKSHRVKRSMSATP